MTLKGLQNLAASIHAKSRTELPGYDPTKRRLGFFALSEAERAPWLALARALTQSAPLPPAPLQTRLREFTATGKALLSDMQREWGQGVSLNQETAQVIDSSLTIGHMRSAAWNLEAASNHCPESFK